MRRRRFLFNDDAANAGAADSRKVARWRDIADDDQRVIARRRPDGERPGVRDRTLRLPKPTIT